MDELANIELMRKHIYYANLEIMKDKHANRNKRWFCRVWVPTSIVDTVIELRTEAEDKSTAVGRMIVYLAQRELLDDFTAPLKKELVLNAPVGMFPVRDEDASKA